MSDLALRRLAPLSAAARPLLAIVLIIASLVVVAVIAPDTRGASVTTVADAEAALIRGINEERSKVGLVALRSDPPLGVIARKRSANMVAGAYFSHTEPDGDTWLDYLSESQISWYSTGEAIAWDRYATLADSVGFARKAWMASAPHRALLLSTSFNYVGVGLAVSGNGTHYWTAVFIRGPDHTDPWVAPKAPALGAPVAGVRTVALAWDAGDHRLQVLTSGLRDVELQRRTDGGAWVSLGWTTARTSRRTAVVGHRVDWRWRARDNAGNVGDWSNPISILP